MIIINIVFDYFFFVLTDPSSPKKNLLLLLSIPSTLKFFFKKKLTDSEPTKPKEPVIKTYLSMIKK